VAINSDRAIAEKLIAENKTAPGVHPAYGRSCISAPKPTIPSMINTSSPITIQPCNAVMFGSFELMVLTDLLSK
jgi:hypothetical protein